MPFLSPGCTGSMDGGTFLSENALRFPTSRAMRKTGAFHPSHGMCGRMEEAKQAWAFRKHSVPA